MVFIITSARREVELREENVAGYLARSARLDVHPLPELRSPEDGPGQPDANHASDEMRAESQTTPATR